MGLYCVTNHGQEQASSESNVEQNAHVHDLGGLQNYQRQPLDSADMGERRTDPAREDTDRLPDLLRRANRTLEADSTAARRKKSERGEHPPPDRSGAEKAGSHVGAFIGTKAEPPDRRSAAFVTREATFNDFRGGRKYWIVNQLSE